MFISRAWNDLVQICAERRWALDIRFVPQSNGTISQLKMSLYSSIGRGEILSATGRPFSITTTDIDSAARNFLGRIEAGRYRDPNVSFKSVAA